MKRFSTLFIALVCFFTLAANAQVTKSQVEQGIQTSNNLIAAHDWSGAFATLRGLDAAIGEGSPALHYLVSKQRYVMYYRIHRNAEVKAQLGAMENYAMASGDNAVIEDMLIVKAGYYGATGASQVSRQCYKTIFDRRSKGKDDAGVEQCYKSLISEAKQKNNTAMASTIQAMYNVWQDSIASERSANELKNVKKQFALAKEEIDDKAGTIAGQWAAIIFLVVVVLGLAAALAFFVLTMFRNINTIKKLRNTLDVVNKSNEQKSVFIRNISGQITPSLDQIAQGNGKLHIPALQKMLKHAEYYMELESTREERYETASMNMSKLCEEIAAKFENNAVPITTDATSMSFPVNKEATMELIEAVIGEVSKCKETERITLGFKKRNPTTGHFVVSAIGMKLAEEEKENLFTAFAKVYDLTETDGLTLPTCSVMALKMGGQLYLEKEFAKGTRFILEVHS